ncbi:hypothetical protein EI94DRAFT_1752925 [Lactarius quietus]|nr:hypothetical protein EI94DRAFT_1752925 [Lactarius quietus]
MQRFALLLLVASVSLLGTVVPAIKATRLVKREENAEGLPPYRHDQRSQDDTVRRSQVSSRVSQDTVGFLEVQFQNGTIVGYVYDDAIGPNGLNLFSNPNFTQPNLAVSFTGGNLIAQSAEFSPTYIGGYGTSILSPQNLNIVQFTNVVSGPDAQIWTFNSTTGRLNATWTNSDGSQLQPTLMYDFVLNALFFTGNPTGLYSKVYNAESALFPVIISLLQ